MDWIECSDQMPRPGVPVIAYYVNDYHKERRIRAQWVPEKFRSTEEMSFEEGSEYDEETDQSYWPAGWYEWNENEEMHWAVNDLVTHWMPLPEPPSNAKLTGAREPADKDQTGMLGRPVERHVGGE